MATKDDFKVGDKVLFGRQQGEQTLGEVVRLGRTKLKVKQLEQRGTMRSYPIGSIWTVPPSLCRKVDGTVAPKATPAPAPKATPRPESAIMDDIRGCYGALSPENLSCDGELSRTETARRGAALRARLRVLFAELGREVSESEAFGLPALPSSLTAMFRRPSAKDSGLKRGDKVTFDAKGQTVVGFVRQVNTKTVSVDPIGSTSGRYWRVSPSLCRKVA